MSLRDEYETDPPPAKEEPAELTGKVVVGADGGEFIGVKSDKPLELASDWEPIFRRFNLDPDHFVIEDDSVRMSTWQQSKRTDDGDRDIINLFSYGARFRRRLASAVNVADIIEHLRSWTPGPRGVQPHGDPVTLFVGWADWQLGKGEGDGTQGTLTRLRESFEKTAHRVEHLRESGVNVASLLVANMGDHTEAVTGHYTAQTYSVDLNQRDQLKVALETNLTGLKALAPLFDDVTYAAVLCNHGQWQRLAGKQITDDSDNSTGFIGDTLAHVASLTPGLDHIRFTIPRDEMITTGTFSGVNVAMAHGHKITGAEENWLSKQSHWLQHQRDFKPMLWLTAHRHTAAINDYGPYFRVQCTTEDPGSKSFTDATGKFSTRGTTTLLIDPRNPRKFSHYEVL